MGNVDHPTTALRPLGISIGEPAGIGPEIILKSWLSRDLNSLPTFVVLGGAAHLRNLAQELKLDVPVETVATEQAASVFNHALPVIELVDETVFKSTHGTANEEDAHIVCGSIAAAVSACMEGTLGGMITAPINKKALYDAGFAFPGHTEFLAELAKEQNGKTYRPVMMLAGPQLRTVPVTIHIPLREVPNALTSEAIVETCRIVAHDLKRRFGIPDPRLAVSGLNPHAGEDGALGKEDAAVIEPALAQLRLEGISITGPLPADTMFHGAARQTYDVAICMYHDQALIPAKTLAFDDAVNATLGLPFIRTSPDHGTAFDIAGKGVANPSSMIAAIKMAGDMAERTNPATRELSK